MQRLKVHLRIFIKTTQGARKEQISIKDDFFRCTHCLRMVGYSNRIGPWIDELEEEKMHRQKFGEFLSQTRERDVTTRPWARSVFVFNNQNGIRINDGDCKVLNGHNV